MAFAVILVGSDGAARIDRDDFLDLLDAAKYAIRAARDFGAMQASPSIPTSIRVLERSRTLFEVSVIAMPGRTE